MTYIMIWLEEEERWDYYLEDFNKDRYPKGYCDYYIDVDENGIIIRDTWECVNEGKFFIDCYDVSSWNR